MTNDRGGFKEEYLVIILDITKTRLFKYIKKFTSKN